MAVSEETSQPSIPLLRRFPTFLLVLVNLSVFNPQAGAQDCQFFTLARYDGDVIDLQIGQSQELETNSIFLDPCISFKILSPDAAIRVDVLDRVDGTTGQYPHVFLYSAVSNAGYLGTDQYCNHNVRVTCVRRSARLPQPDILVPFDYESRNTNEDNDHNLRRVADFVGHKVLVLRRAYLWENSEDLRPFDLHGPYADNKVETLDPSILSFSFDQVGDDLQLKADRRIGKRCRVTDENCDNATCVPNECRDHRCSITGAACGQYVPCASNGCTATVMELPGPIWSGYAPIWFPDPYDEWIDGPWGMTYSNIVAWDWGTSPNADAAIAVGGGEAGPSDDYLGAQLVTLRESEQRDVTISLWSFGWITVRTITVTGPEPPVTNADVYWYRGWDGSYPEEVYGPPTIACPDYPAAEDCQRQYGSQFYPLPDTQFFDFAARSAFEQVRVGLLTDTEPPVLLLKRAQVFTLADVPRSVERGGSLSPMRARFFNYGTSPDVVRSIRLILSGSPISPDVFGTIDLGAASLEQQVQPKTFTWVPVGRSDGTVPCGTTEGPYYLGTRTNEGPPSTPSNIPRINVTKDQTPPSVACPAPATVECTGNGGVLRDDPQLAAFFAAASASDACGAVISNDAPNFFPFDVTDVTFTAQDPDGNTSQCLAPVHVVDTIPPAVVLTISSPALPADGVVPFSMVYRSSDTCGIRHEVISIAGCPVFDGATYGNKDGLLSDEQLNVSKQELCRIASECGFSVLNRPAIRVESVDYGGNESFAEKTWNASVALRPGLCTR